MQKSALTDQSPPTRQPSPAAGRPPSSSPRASPPLALSCQPGSRQRGSTATSRLDPYILRWKGDATDPSKADVALLRAHYAKQGLSLVRDTVGLRLEAKR